MTGVAPYGNLCLSMAYGKPARLAVKIAWKKRIRRRGKQSPEDQVPPERLTSLRQVTEDEPYHILKMSTVSREEADAKAIARERERIAKVLT